MTRRNDPRAERQMRDPRSGRIRIDRSHPRADVPAAAPLRGGVASQSPEPSRQLRQVTIEAPRSIVIAVPDLERGRLTALDRDLIGAARVLADAGHGAVVVVVPSACADDLGCAGADRVVRFEAPAAGAHAPAALATALVELAQRHQASHLLFADTLTAGGDLGRRVAARLGVRPAVRVAALTATEAIGRSDSGRREIVRAPPRVLLLEAGCAEPVTDARHQALAMEQMVLGAQADVIDLGAVAVDRSAVPLIEAELIVSAGAGVSDWAAFHRLAAQLGAAEGASRVVCDAGFLPRDRQIGASGWVVEARGYLAFGISGAPQHLQGIAQCERVIAVNADQHAPMIQRADLAIVADAQQVMPALADLIEGVRRGA
jgi:electron transfer flavoprotein alpha subunit